MATEREEVSESDRYRELGRLGSGGMATVTLAEDTLLRRPVALKRLHTSAGEREFARLRREALVGASLNHPNLVTVYDVYDEDDGQLVIVMEYVPGETLHQAIRTGGMIPPRQALEILRQLAAALDAIHARGVVHRDVKPANVLLGTGGAVKLADLGIAAAADRTQTTAGAEMAGTFSYMAPEQLEGRASNATIDIYALAAVAFEMLSGRKARREANPVALAHAISTRPPPDLRRQWPDAPAQAAAVLRVGMSADPAKRPSSAGGLVARLAEAFDPRTTQLHAAPSTGTPSPVPPKPPAPTPAPPVTRRVPRTQPAPRPTDGSSRAAVGVAPRLGASPGRSTRNRPPGMLAGPAHRRRPSLGRPAHAGALLILLLAAAAVALAAGLGSGGAAKRSSTGRAGKASTKHASHSVATAHSSASSEGPAGQGASANSASATSSAHAATELNPPASSVPQTLAGSSPVAAVEAFYGHAAHHEYAAAWRLADTNMRNQLGGFESFQVQQSAVRSITFRRAEVVASTGTSSSATVVLKTEAVLADRTEQCGGTARIVRSSRAGWLLDGISINCTP